MKFNRTAPFALSLALLLAANHATLRTAYSAETGEIEAAEVENTKAPVAAPKWSSEVQTKYNLTDAQMKSMTDAGIKGPQLAITAELAKASGKTTDEIIKMRTTDKMGWGKIAKTLGVPPSTIGQSVSALHRDLKEKREEKHEEKNKEKREERKQRREERKKEHQEEKADKAAHPGNSH
jgi:hypothetical protein